MNNYTKEQVKAIIGLHSQACRDCEEQVRIAHSMGDHEQGRFWIGIWEDHIRHWAQIANDAYGPGKPARDLTRREKQILKILQENRQAPATIAGRINISVNAVHTYLARLKSHGVDIQKKTVATRRENRGYYKIYWVDQKKEA